VFRSGVQYYYVKSRETICAYLTSDIKERISLMLRGSVLFQACLIRKVIQWLQPFDIH
jgi:hypothetical protein